MDIARLNIIYQQKDPHEIAVNTVHFQVQPGTGNEFYSAQDLADAAMPAFLTWWNSVAGVYAAGTKPQRLDAYTLDPVTLKATGKGTAVVPGSISVPGGGALPPQVAWALTLYGYPPAGWAANRARKRGRIYLGPLSTIVLDTTGSGNVGRPDTSHRDTVLNASAIWLSSWQNLTLGSSGAIARVGVLSTLDKVVTTLQSISIDDVLDTQRRRSNALIPVRTIHDLAG
jgi:hypothetical protein